MDGVPQQKVRWQLHSVAEARVSRTHQRKARLPLTGFEDREHHRILLASIPPHGSESDSTPLTKKKIGTGPAATNQRGGSPGVARNTRPTFFRNAGLLAGMESARRWPRKSGELGSFLFPRRLEEPRLRNNTGAANFTAARPIDRRDNTREKLCRHPIIMPGPLLNSWRRYGEAKNEQA